MALSAASCLAQSSPLHATQQKHTHGHLVKYSPKSHHCRNNTFRATSFRVQGSCKFYQSTQDLNSCSDLHLFLEDKISPRDIKRSHQLSLHLLPVAVFRWLAICSKQFLILLCNMDHHVTYLPVEALHCLQEHTPVERVQQVTLMCGSL